MLVFFSDSSESVVCSGCGTVSHYITCISCILIKYLMISAALLWFVRDHFERLPPVGTYNKLSSQTGSVCLSCCFQPCGHISQELVLSTVAVNVNGAGS